MKILNLFLGLLFLAFIASCSDDDNEEKYSDLSSEEHKAKIEDVGLDVISQLEGMANLDAIQILIDFDQLDEGIKRVGVQTVTKPLTDFKAETGTVLPMKTPLLGSSAFSLADEFLTEAGIYTYNAVTNLWDITEATDQITYHFPTEGSETNNATLSVTEFLSHSVTNPDMPEDMTDLLESVKVTLTVDNEELMKFTFAAQYDGNDIPLSAEENFYINEYKITSSMSRSNSKISFDQSFALDGTTILSSHFDSNGNFDYDAFMEGIESSDESFFSQSVIDAANVWIAIGNLKLQGVGNWKALRGSEDDFQDITSEQEYSEKMADLLNKNLKMYVKYVDSNEIIASTEFYAYEEDDYEESYWDLNVRIKFGDGSYMDDSFFSKENFSELIESAQDFMAQMDENYGMSY